MTDLLITLGAIGLVAGLDAWGRTRRAPRPVPPRRNYDALAPLAPLYGARRLPTRPLRPYTAQEQALIATVWGADTLEVARPARLGWDATERKDN